MNDNSLENDEASGDVSKNFDSYIGTGAAHIPAPNKDYREELIKEDRPVITVDKTSSGCEKLEVEETSPTIEDENEQSGKEEEENDETTPDPLVDTAEENTTLQLEKEEDEEEEKLDDVNDEVLEETPPNESIEDTICGEPSQKKAKLEIDSNKSSDDLFSDEGLANGEESSFEKVDAVDDGTVEDEKSEKDEKEEAEKRKAEAKKEERLQMEKERQERMNAKRAMERAMEEREMLEKRAELENLCAKQDEQMNHLLDFHADNIPEFLPDLSKDSEDVRRSTLVYADGLPIPFRNHGNISIISGNVFTRQAWRPQYKFDEDNQPGRQALYRHDIILEQKLDDYLGSFNCFSAFLSLLMSFQRTQNATKFRNLGKFYKEAEAEERKEEVLATFKLIAELARKGMNELPMNIAKLAKEKNRSVTLSQQQCAYLLALFFLQVDSDLNIPNFSYILSHPMCYEKLKFIMCYFDTIRKKGVSDGNVSFRRSTNNNRTSFADLRSCVLDEYNLQSSKVFFDSEFKIEDAPGCSQVDFANAYIGGGVLEAGSVQEEIRFLCSPEMIIAMYLTHNTKDVNNKMCDDEAIFIVGAERYSSYEGYADSLKWLPLSPKDKHANQLRDDFKRINYELIAIDATDFKSNRSSQYKKFQICREFNKCIAGFRGVSHVDTDSATPIISGWWGCGVFKGDKLLKTMLQIAAATVVNRPIVFCTFDEIRDQLTCMKVYNMLKKRTITVGELLNILVEFEAGRRFSYLNSSLLADHILHSARIARSQQY